MTAPYSFDGSRRTLSSRLAVVAAVLAAGVLGVSVGYHIQTTLAVVGGLLFGRAAGAMAADDLASRVRGSGLLLGASVFVVLALVLEMDSVAGAVLVGMVALAVGLTALASRTTLEAAGLPLLHAALRSFLVLVVGTLLAAALYADVFTSIALGAWGVYGGTATAIPFAGLLALQVELLAIGLLATKAGQAASDIDPGRVRAPSIQVGVRDIPLAVWALLAVQFLVLALPGGAATFSALLGSIGPVGAVLAGVLTSPFLHGALVVLAGVLALLPIANAVRKATVRVVGSRPPKSFAYAVGGVVFVALVILATSVGPVVDAVYWLVRGNEPATAVFETYGVSPATLAAVTGALAAGGGLLFALVSTTALSFVPARTTGFVFGAIGLFGAAAAGAFANAHAPAVFLGIAAAIVVWDLGDYATTAGAELGQATATRSIETTHATGTLAVAVLAVVVASLATHFLVPAMTGLDESRALTALGLLVIAVLAFAVAVGVDGESAE
jgi:hypothetical protein